VFSPPEADVFVMNPPQADAIKCNEITIRNIVPTIPVLVDLPICIYDSDPPAKIDLKFYLL